MAVGKPVLEMEEAELDQVFNVDLRGAWLMAQTVATHMAKFGRGGSIINIASITAFRPAGGIAAYATAKAAVVQMTQAMALELSRHAIRVNALAPGYIETAINREFFATPAGEAMIKRIPMRRLGRAEDLDGPLLLLASDASAYMTGSTIVVDGGHLQSTL
jgi:NAD(P)-dependent dehydrogenase (short-subunit alcohol dehydrogenase family)